MSKQRRDFLRKVGRLQFSLEMKNFSALNVQYWCFWCFLLTSVKVYLPFWQMEWSKSCHGSLKSTLEFKVTFHHLGVRSLSQYEFCLKILLRVLRLLMKCSNLQTRKLENPKKINDVIRHNSTMFEHWVLEFEAYFVIFTKVAKSKETLISGKFCQILFFSPKRGIYLLNYALF